MFVDDNPAECAEVAGALPEVTTICLPSQPEEIFVRILDWRHLVRLYHPLRAVAPVWRAPVERLGNPWVITRHADAGVLVRDTALVKASLARLETQRASGTLVRRLPGLRLATEVLEYKPQLHLHGLATLPVAW